MQEAMNQVKETLGRDAIILHTRKFRKGGIGGFFGREMVEVMAAVDNDLPMVTLSSAANPNPKTAKTRTSSGPVRSLVRTAVKAEKNEITKSSVFKIEETTENDATILGSQIEKTDDVREISKEKEQVEIVAENVVFGPLALPNITIDKSIAIETTEKLEKAQLVTQNTDIVVLGKDFENIPEDDLKNEISGMRQMLEQLLTKTKTVPTNPWYEYLIKKDIQPNFAEQILKGFPYSLTTLNKNPEATKKMLYDRFIGYIRTNNGIKLNGQGECKKIALIGPTGVGKTTTLAKLAARFTLENSANVAFITSDTLVCQENPII